MPMPTNKRELRKINQRIDRSTKLRELADKHRQDLEARTNKIAADLRALVADLAKGGKYDHQEPAGRIRMAARQLACITTASAEMNRLVVGVDDGRH